MNKFVTFVSRKNRKLEVVFDDSLNCFAEYYYELLIHDETLLEIITIVNGEKVMGVLRKYAAIFDNTSNVFMDVTIEALKCEIGCEFKAISSSLGKAALRNKFGETYVLLYTKQSWIGQDSMIVCDKEDKLNKWLMNEIANENYSIMYKFKAEVSFLGRLNIEPSNDAEIYNITPDEFTRIKEYMVRTVKNYKEFKIHLATD